MSVILGIATSSNTEQSLSTPSSASLRSVASSASTVVRTLDSASLRAHDNDAASSASDSTDFKQSSGKSSMDSLSTRSDRSEERSGSSRPDENHIEAIDGNHPRLSRSASSQFIQNNTARSYANSTLSEQISVNNNELEALIKVLQSPNPAEVVDALKALEAVSHSSRELSLRIGEMGVIPRVVELAKSGNVWSHLRDTQGYSYLLLSTLANLEPNRVEIRKTRIMDHIFFLLDHQALHEEVDILITVAVLLRQLLRNERARKTFRTEVSLGKSLAGLLASRHAEVLLQAVELVYEYCKGSRSNQDAIVDEGGLERLCEHLAHDSLKVQEGAARALVSLVNGNTRVQSQPLMGLLIDRLDHIIREPSHPVYLLAVACTCLGTVVTDHEENKRRVLLRVDVQPLVDFLHRQEPVLQEGALYALRCMARDPISKNFASSAEMKEILRKKKALVQTVQLLFSPEDGVRVQAAGVLFESVKDNPANRDEIAVGMRTRGFKPLIALLDHTSVDMQYYVLGVLASLAERKDLLRALNSLHAKAPVLKLTNSSNPIIRKAADHTIRLLSVSS